MASIKSIAEDAAKIAQVAEHWECADLGDYRIHDDLEEMKDEPEHLVERLKEEETYWAPFEKFDSREAMVIGLAILELWSLRGKSNSNNNGIAVTVTLFNGVILFASAIGDHVSADNFEWARRKTNTVKRFGTSSWMRGRSRVLKGKPADDPLLGPDYAAHGGAYPIRVKGSKYPIGAIAVSGLTQSEDHGLVTAVLSRFLQFHQPGSYLGSRLSPPPK